MKQERFHIGLGIFIVGAVLIAAATAVTLYNQYLQGKIETYVMFFKGSLSGLEAGSPVLYRGVKIGKVNRIELTANKAQTNVAIPVYVEFFVEKSFAQRNNPIKVLIGNNMVATITAPSLFTGKSTIKLVPADKKRNIIWKPTLYHDYARFPTQNINEDSISINDALKTAEKSFKDISLFFQSKKVQDMIQSFTNMAHGVESFASGINTEVPVAFRSFNEGLRSFSRAADSTKNLTDYLARHPESLLRGKS